MADHAFVAAPEEHKGNDRGARPGPSHAKPREKVVQRSAEPGRFAPGAAGQFRTGLAPLMRAPAPASGNGLPAPLRTNLEALSGFAMDEVRVHRNSAEPARLGALAFARGSDIHLGPGQEKHLPHEAWHVVQQKQGRVKATTQMKGVGVNEDSGLEAEADRMGDHAKGLNSEHVTRPTQAQVETGSLNRAARGITAQASLQFDAGLATSPIQRRRVPQKNALEAALPHPDPQFHPGRHLPSFAGTAVLLARAWADLAHVVLGSTPDNVNFTATAAGLAMQRTVQTQMAGLLRWTNEFDLRTALAAAPRLTILAFAEAIRQANAASILGHPKEIGVKAGTKAEKANLRTLQTNINTIFNLIAGTSLDVSLGQVFGVPNVATAKTKYNKGRLAINKIIDDHVMSKDPSVYYHNGHKIPAEVPGVFTDRSQYFEEVRKAGEASSTRIYLMKRFIDNPNDVEAQLTAIHEGVHSGNTDVEDKGYAGSPSFTTLSVAEKLTNAAHYEVVPSRQLGGSNAYVGQVFVPTAVAPPATPALAQQASALRKASERFRKARAAAGRLHEFLVQLFLQPKSWSRRHARGLPFWSSMEMLTIHQRLPRSRPGFNPAFKGVTIIDIALSEGLLRKLALGSSALRQDGTALAASLYAPGESTDGPLRDRIVGQVISNYTGIITVSVGRDQCVIARLAQAAAYRNNEEFLANGGPGNFDAQPCITDGD
ncbi:MAG: hypothetical protein QOJ94_1197 [Sphingomonadales bacterium]|nr:hypothetical protein [Sphingomonadales bacterium]